MSDIPFSEITHFFKNFGTRHPPSSIIPMNIASQFRNVNKVNVFDKNRVFGNKWILEAIWKENFTYIIKEAYCIYVRIILKLNRKKKILKGKLFPVHINCGKFGKTWRKKTWALRINFKKSVNNTFIPPPTPPHPFLVVFLFFWLF